MGCLVSVARRSISIPAGSALESRPTNGYWTWSEKSELTIPEWGEEALRSSPGGHKAEGGKNGTGFILRLVACQPSVNQKVKTQNDDDVFPASISKVSQSHQGIVVNRPNQVWVADITYWLTPSRLPVHILDC